MKTIIAGGRNVTDAEFVFAAIQNSGFQITEVVSGAAHGVDEIGERWAGIHGVPVKLFPADWPKYGNGAGPIRNREMAAYADALVAVWNGVSRGTKNMIDEAKKRGLKIHVAVYGRVERDPAAAKERAR